MARIKLFGLIPRKPDVSPQEFHDHYRHPHGTIGRNISTIRQYCQSHQIPTDLLNDKQTRFEAVAEIWLDSQDDMLKFREEPLMVEHIIDDELLFIDMPNLRFLIVDEEVLVSSPDACDKTRSPGDIMWSAYTRPTSIKILHFIEPDGNPDWQTEEDKVLGERIGAFRHVRCTPLQAFDSDGPSQEAPHFLGARELWWPTVTDFQKGVRQDPEAFRKLIGNQEKATTLLAQTERWQ